MTDRPDVRIGVVGTGFVSKHFVMSLDDQPGYDVSRVLSRRPLDSIDDYPRPEALTSSVEDLVEHSDVVLECSGDPIYAAEVVNAAVEAGRPVVTMNTEFHVTVGSYFAGRGLVTEAEGDQPGCQAALHEEALELGFRPLAYGNMKGFLNEDPTPEEMGFWGPKQGISLAMVTSFTDGTKVQAEQALVANHFGAGLAKEGLLGIAEDDLRTAGNVLAEHAKALGRPIAEYVLSGKLPHGVFIVAEHDPRQTAALEYLKLGPGPYYVIQKTNIFVHLEILKTIKRVMNGGGILLHNTETPGISVATIAKRDMQPGEQLPYGIGSFDVRGICVEIAQRPGHVPIGLVQNAVVKRPVERGQVLTFDDLELPESFALTAWQAVEQRVLGGVAAR